MIVVNCEQGTPEWAEARRGIATASRFGSILTPKKMELAAAAHGYACELVAETLVAPHCWLGDEYSSAPMQRGITTEDEARDYFAFQQGVEVQRVGFCMTDDKRFGCSPDGLVGDDAGLELKCPLHKTQVKYLLDGGLPDEYKAQVHGSMIVTKRSHWWFMSYAVGLPPLLIKVEPDEYTLKLAAALEEFWKLYTSIRDRVLGEADPILAKHAEPQPYF